ncbi:MAG TPA: MBL fold metallo-hydrolase [Polyangiaceae bacterium]|nr:MBL fold metallo-hydrolase [Polyangiaceae bacterium]
MSRLVVLLFLLSFGCGCARAPLAPPFTRNLDLEALEIAVRFDDPTPIVVMNLANQYLATGRDREGHSFFCERSRNVPERALFSALCGVFQARTAAEIPLLRRVAGVEDALARLDAAATRDGLSRYLRGVTCAALPERFERKRQAETDLQWVLDHPRAFPPGLLRGARQALRVARGEVPADEPAFVTTFSVDARDGFRFVSPELVEPAPGVFVARGYDFADIAFVVTDDGVVAIDAGTSEQNAAAALAAFRKVSAAPIRTLLLTHAHWDHVGGVRTLAAGGAQVIAQAAFASELALASAAPVPFRFFFGDHTPQQLDVRPDRLVAQPETLSVGGTRFELYPAHGGETDDALVIHLPERGVTFVGDAFMPYFGAPFVPEGSVEGLLATIALLRSLRPALLIHGHAPLTENFPMAVLPALEQALRTLYQGTLAALRAGKPLSDALGSNLMPPSLAQHPDAVLPYLLMRENLVKRVYQQRTGYWHADGEGIEVFSRAEQAAALDLVAGGSAAALGRAVTTLVERGDHALALRVADLGLARHSSHAELLAARQRALAGLRLKNQFNPFKFIVYSELAGAELAAPPGSSPPPRR